MKKKDDDAAVTLWRQWRGPDRDGTVANIPHELPAKPTLHWERPLLREGLGGIAADHRYVVFGSRDADDLTDVWTCLDIRTGTPLWKAEQFAVAAYDYGNTPRATPLLTETHAYLQGAAGDLLCVMLKSGEVAWRINFDERFGTAGELPWGFCGSPLLADDKLIVQPGSQTASIAALDPKTGATLWQTPGRPPGYGSLIVGTFGGVRQIVGHDATTLGGWELKTGRRLWTVTPSGTGDFNVPTPIDLGGRLLVTTENNGTRLFEFGADGVINPEPTATNTKLGPNMSTPVVVGSRLYCVDRFLYCLDLADDLKELWRIRDEALDDYAAIIADDSHLLVFAKGTILSLSADGSKTIESRTELFDQNDAMYAHPAFVRHPDLEGFRLVLRGHSGLKCVSWDE